VAIEVEKLNKTDKKVVKKKQVETEEKKKQKQVAVVGN
jgi:hypothetical protein